MISLALALMLMAAGDPPASPPATPPAAAPDDSQKVICKYQEVTGSRFGKQECHTKAEWAEITRNAREFTDKATSNNCGGNRC